MLTGCKTCRIKGDVVVGSVPVENWSGTGGEVGYARKGMGYNNSHSQSLTANFILFLSVSISVSTSHVCHN